MMPFFVLFVAIPLLELTVFVYSSRLIGLGTTLLLCLLTALIGGGMVRHQGLHTLMNARMEMARGGVPSREMFDGLCIVAAGALLMTPGFVTDMIGFLLLIPPVRDKLRDRMAKSGRFEAHHYSSEGFSPEGRIFRAANDPSVIEGEYEDLDEQTEDKKSGPRAS
ncbi:MAG: FxsA family protein [Alphaproteobacteria bacterium]|nr:FxsA family protein [Alphaproteobacteria bacterium]MCB9975068.1 FxsA family protein [Rhodospirillales bacterium]